VLVRIGAVISLVVLALGYAGCRPPQGNWEKLTEITNSSGVRFIVAQQHYDWVEGWAVNFFFIDSNDKIHGSSLQIETGPWGNVRIAETNESIRVWRGTELVAVYLPSSGVFENCLYNTFATNLSGAVLPADFFVK
jgi:hypothetical protein